MSLPQGSIWQALRSRAIDAVPSGTFINLNQPLTLAAWQSSGSYIVTATSSKSFLLLAPATDFGAALISDAQLNLDHAAEHQAALMHDLRSRQWNSPAWMVTTFYYWSYFVAMALTRLLGNTVWFLTKPIADQLARLAPSSSGKIGAGTFELICGPSVSASDRELRLIKRNLRVHEQLWVTSFSLLREAYNSVPQISMDALEQRLYLALLNGARYLGSEWPSALRNVVNYRPGFAYDAVKSTNLLDSFAFIKIDGADDVDVVIDRLENNGIAAKNARSVEDIPRLAAHMLVDITLLLNLLTNTLHEEVVERHGLDRRWILRRNSFLTKQGIIKGHREWPC